MFRDRDGWLIGAMSVIVVVCSVRVYAGLSAGESFDATMVGLMVNIAGAAMFGWAELVAPMGQSNEPGGTGAT